MILRCSDRALTEYIARTNIRVTALWEELDAVQLEISDLFIARPLGTVADSEAYRTLTTREREIIAELDRIDS